MENISVQELKSRLESNDHLVLIDVRTPAEFEEVHVTGAKNIPLGTLNEGSLEKLAERGANVFFICQFGGRSSQASQKIESAGFWQVFNILGGTNAAKEAGLSITRGARKVMSIERQVRVIAGSLTLLGVVFGFVLSPFFFLLSGFVGAGLTLAGVTDSCGMALVLERCPWNQCKT